jgi:glutaredoxin
MFLARLFVAAGSLALLAATSLAPGDASAQQIFKIVGPDGRVTFSDKPPTEPNTKASAASVVPLATEGTSLASLPFEIRQAATRYPVTLYTSPGCVTCATGRAMLTSRGVPFSEKTVATKEDGEALSRMAGTTSVPLLTIGSQQLKGYSDSEWTQFLDAAGYPKTSQLPAGYVPSPATPLVALDGAARPAAPGRRAAQQAEAPSDAAPAPAAENPAGIKF